MNGLILSDNLEMTNIAEMTTKQIKNLKMSDVDFAFQDMPVDYQKAFVRLTRDLAEEKLTEEERAEIHKLLGEMWEQIMWILEQKKVTDLVGDIPENLKNKRIKL